MNRYLQKAMLLHLSIILLLLTGCNKQHSGKRANMVILIGIDGMSVKGFQNAKTPNLDTLFRNGAISLNTRAVMPTVSAPNWGSHLLGAGPEQHGITANGWTTDNHTVEPTVKDDGGYFPSVFSLIREKIPEAKTGFFYDWEALGDLYNLSTIDKVEFSGNYEETFQKAIPWIIEKEPEFSFLYIGHPDEVGHHYEWHSPEYYQALEEVDDALGKFFSDLKKSDLWNNTHIMVVTDHGGVGHGHGGLSMAEIEVPWIISGPGIIKDKLIEQPNDVYNTASTIAWLFHLRQPEAWTGRPVLGAFRSEIAFSGKNIHSFVPQPVSTLESGIYTISSLISFSVEPDIYEIRYTKDGSDPSENSNLFIRPVSLQKSTIVKAAAFFNGSRSKIIEIDFEKVNIINNIELLNPPAEKYYGNGSASLFDGIRGSSDFNDKAWLGFHGNDMIATLKMEKPEPMNHVRIRFLKNEGSWIFLPDEIEVLASVDGKQYIVIGKLTSDQIRGRSKRGINTISLKVPTNKSNFIKIIARNQGTCPAGHPGEGEKAWLFADEILIN